MTHSGVSNSSVGCVTNLSRVKESAAVRNYTYHCVRINQLKNALTLEASVTEGDEGNEEGPHCNSCLHHTVVQKAALSLSLEKDCGCWWGNMYSTGNSTCCSSL